jgi:hypothetical protein
MLKQHSERYTIEHAEHWRSTIDLIPELQFPAHWKIQLIPPYGGAMARFMVNQRISVYLDFHNALGIMNRPYWEAYDTKGNTDPERFYIYETTELLNYITECLTNHPDDVEEHY